MTHALARFCVLTVACRLARYRMPSWCLVDEIFASLRHPLMLVADSATRLFCFQPEVPYSADRVSQRPLSACCCCFPLIRMVSRKCVPIVHFAQPYYVSATQSLPVEGNQGVAKYLSAKELFWASIALIPCSLILVPITLPRVDLHPLFDSTARCYFSSR